MRFASVNDAWRANTMNFGCGILDKRVGLGKTYRDSLWEVDKKMPQPQITAPEAAIRLARAIASDLSLYNEEKIIEGLENDNLFDALRDEIEEGRVLYKSRVSPDLYGSTNYYDRALVDIIVKSKGHIKTKIW